MISMSPEIVNMLGAFVKMLSSTREALLFAGLVIVGAVVISYTIYGAYKFGVYALRLRPHYFGLMMFILGSALVLVSMLIPG